MRENTAPNPKITPILLQGEDWTNYTGKLPKGMHYHSLTAKVAGVGIDPFEATKRSIEEAVAKGETPLLILEGHGTFNARQMRHEILMDESQRSAFLLTYMIDSYQTAYAQAHPDQPIPKLRIALDSCFGESILQDLPVEVAKGADLYITDSQNKVTYRYSDAATPPFFSTFLSYHDNAEEQLAKQWLAGRREAYSQQIPLLMTSRMRDGTEESVVIDGDALRDKVTPKDLSELKQSALKQLKALDWSADTKQKVNEAFAKLTPQTIEAAEYPQQTALLGMLADYEHRFTPLAAYHAQREALENFYAPRKKGESLEEEKERLAKNAATLNALDPNLLTHMLPWNLLGGKDYLLPRYQALVAHGVNPLHGAASTSNVNTALEVIPATKRSAWLDALNEDGWTPFYVAAQKGHTDTVKALLTAGANPNQANKDGWTPLHVAAKNGHTDTVKALIAGGADPNLPIKNGGTPLYVAAEKGHTDAMKALLAAGADPNLPSKDGYRALDIATQNSHTEAANILLATSILQDAGADANRDGKLSTWEGVFVLPQSFVRKAILFPDVKRFTSQLESIQNSLTPELLAPLAQTTLPRFDANHDGKTSTLEVALALMASGVSNPQEIQSTESLRAKLEGIATPIQAVSARGTP